MLIQQYIYQMDQNLLKLVVIVLIFVLINLFIYYECLLILDYLYDLYHNINNIYYLMTIIYFLFRYNLNLLFLMAPFYIIKISIFIFLYYLLQLIYHLGSSLYSRMMGVYSSQ